MQAIKKLVGQDAYPVFIMFEQLYLRKFLNFNTGLEAVWEHCVYEYKMFQGSKFDDSKKSEYDCIREYVLSIPPPPTTDYYGDDSKTSIE